MSELRAGDVVKHTPSGETWVLAYRDGEYVAPCGWPACEARTSDCELVRAATDAEHRAMLEKWTALHRRGGCDSWDRRPAVCFEQLCLLNQSFVGLHI